MLKVFKYGFLLLFSISIFVQLKPFQSLDAKRSDSLINKISEYSEFQVRKQLFESFNRSESEKYSRLESDLLSVVGSAVVELECKYWGSNEPSIGSTMCLVNPTNLKGGAIYLIVKFDDVNLSLKNFKEDTFIIDGTISRIEYPLIKDVILAKAAKLGGVEPTRLFINGAASVK